MGNVLFGMDVAEAGINLMSPDNTSDGWLRKKWAIIDGKRCLIKGGSGVMQQEPYNEVFASTVMERLGIAHVPYALMEQDGYPYSVCEDFITPQTELVSAWHIMQMKKKANHVNFYQHYMDCCEMLGIRGIREFLDRMIVLDYLIVNEDRHLNNFGVIRNADTLEWGGAAPIYDSGTSLWFSTPTGFIGGNGARLTCKPFKTSHEEQLKLVTSFDWLELHQLSDIEDAFRSIVGNSLFLDANRVDVICRAITKRVDMLQEHVNTRVNLLRENINTRVDMLQAHVNTRVETDTMAATAGDVLRDEAYSGNENA